MSFLQFYFSPNGRISLGGFWLKFILPYFAISIVFLILIATFFFPESAGNDPKIAAGKTSELLLIMTPILLPIWWASIAVLFKRLHDRNLSGFWFLAPLAVALVAHAIHLVTASLSQPFHLGGAEIPIPLLVGVPAAMLLNIWLFINVYFLPGTRGQNKYGRDPRERSQ